MRPSASYIFGPGRQITALQRAPNRLVFRAVTSQYVRHCRLNHIPTKKILEYKVLCTPISGFMRSRIAKRRPPDADKLVGLSLALFASGSRTEDRFWEAKLDALLAKIVRSGNQTTLDAALDHLQQNHPDAYGALADMAETHSESFIIEHDGVSYEALLIAAPVLAWTRYVIPSGPLKTDAADALRAHLQAHVLAANTRVAMAPFMYSIDQLPRQHVETWRLAQQLAQAAVGGGTAK